MGLNRHVADDAQAMLDAGEAAPPSRRLSPWWGMLLGYLPGTLLSLPGIVFAASTLGRLIRVPDELNGLDAYAGLIGLAAMTPFFAAAAIVPVWAAKKARGPRWPVHVAGWLLAAAALGAALQTSM